MTEGLEESLQAVVRSRLAGCEGIQALHRLSAGASMETWSFDALGTSHPLPLILRRAPPSSAAAEDFGKLATEAAVIQAAVAAGVPAPVVRYVLQADDGLGAGFLMERLAGETIARKILRDSAHGAMRGQLLEQIAASAARIHAVPLERLPSLRHVSPAQTLEDWRAEYQQQSCPRPVFELALRWLHDHLPGPGSSCLVHGDYRMGNLMIGPTGLTAVLDWELCHVGDPLLDLAWLCVPPWRFGQIDAPAGGLGSREALYAAYESASGTRVDRARCRYWEVFGSLRWGLMCAGMLDWFRSGRDRSVERAMIARRASESELDLLRALQECADAG